MIPILSLITLQFPAISISAQILFEHIVTISSVLSIIQCFVVSHQFNQFLFHCFFKRDVAQCMRVTQLRVRNTERRSSVVVLGELTVILDRPASDPELSGLDSSHVAPLNSTPLHSGPSGRLALHFRLSHSDNASLTLPVAVSFRSLLVHGHVTAVLNAATERRVRVVHGSFDRLTHTPDTNSVRPWIYQGLLEWAKQSYFFHLTQETKPISKTLWV
jgi:hypothetical protein